MASGTFSTTTNMAGFLALANGGSWSTTTNAAANTSTMSVSFAVTKRSGFSRTFGTGTWGINVDGTNYSSGAVFRSVSAGEIVTIHSVSGIVIGHNTNGSRSVSISISGGIGGTSWTTTTGSTTAVLDDYDRRPVFSDSTLASPATRGTAYSDGVSASLTSSYSIVSGALPTGIGLNTSNGVVSGTPTVVGTFNFTIRANGSAEGSTDIARTIVVNPALPTFTDSTVVSTASVGTAYSDGVSATETASYSVFSGALPGGITLNTTTGAITGTPTTPGVFNFVIRATNVTGTRNTGTLTITVTSGAKVWNGTAFVAGTTRAWNGTAFVSTTTRVWNGSAWTSAK
jgi:predicted hotdog family 3-hydroxylacyl-ACP dehydratase